MDIQNMIKKLVKENYSNIFIWTDTKGTYYNWHSHTYEEIRIILKGEIIINTKNNTYHLKSGDVLKVPAGEIHNAEVLEDCKYICGSKI